MVSIIHDVRYYETDKMGVVHHSNYIRWFEDARLAWLEQAGTPFAEAEEEGLISPVIAISCDYKNPAKFGDRIRLHIQCTKYNGIRLEYAYKAMREDGTILVTGTSKHCFMTDESPGPVPMQKIWPAMYENILAAHQADLLEAKGDV